MNKDYWREKKRQQRANKKFRDAENARKRERYAENPSSQIEASRAWNEEKKKETGIAPQTIYAREKAKQEKLMKINEITP